MKLQLLNELGIPVRVNPTDAVKVLLPYHAGVLEKAVDILDGDSGMIETVLSDFELQGLKEGAGQTFWATLRKGNQIFTFEFSKLLNVGTRDGKKQID